jgi:FMN-binding domain/4Fe-4S binding domain
MGKIEIAVPAKWSRKRVERYLALATIPIMLIAAFLGMARSNADLEPIIARALPAATSFKPLGDQGFAGLTAESGSQPVGYVKISEAEGYGGPLTLAVAVDPGGVIRSVGIVEHRETPSYFQRVSDSTLIDSLVGKGYLDEVRLGEDVDGVSGATYTSRAIISAARLGLRSIAAGQLDQDVPGEKPPEVRFGIPELVLILLISVWTVSDRKGFQLKKQARWFTLLASMIVLGFLYTSLLTLPFMTKMVMGFWPQWQNSLYWYTLLGFFLATILLKGKNPYCQWFCPFGAVQETLGMVGGAKSRNPIHLVEFFRWLPRGLALTAILAALLFRNSGISSYEVFGTLFDLEGSPFQFGLLATVLVISLLVRRPWCRFLCPIGAIADYLRTMRGWVREKVIREIDWRR